MNSCNWRRWASVLPLGLWAAILITGPAADAADATQQFPEAAGILDECVAAETALLSTKAAAGKIDEAYRSALYVGQAHVAQAYRLALLAPWPDDLASTRTKLSVSFVTTIGKLAGLDRPPAAMTPADLRTALTKEAVRVHRSTVLLQGLAPATVVPLPPPPPAPAPPPPVFQIPAGATAFAWTDLSPSADSKVYYVSSSSGSDSNDGLSPNSPFKTIGKGSVMLRDGFPDWLLLKRGDTWTGERIGMGLGNGVSRSGRSALEPMVFWSYGSSRERPKIINGYFWTNYNEHVSNLAVVGLHFELVDKTLQDVNIGLRMLAYGDNILLEDLYVAGFTSNISVQAPSPTNRVNNLKIRGCVIVDAGSHGILMDNVAQGVVEGNVVDYNGWHANTVGRESNMFNHDMYMYWAGNPLIVRNNIVARASATGFTMPSGVAEDNLVLQNAIGMWSSKYTTVRRNVFLDGRDIDGGNARGFGIWLDGGDGGEVYENVVAHQTTGTGGPAILIDRKVSNFSIHDNIVYNWSRYGATAADGVCLATQGAAAGSIQIRNNIFQIATGYMLRFDVTPGAGIFQYSGNRYYSGGDASRWFGMPADYGADTWGNFSGETGATFTEMTFPAPDRSAASYNAILGGDGTLDAFLNEARKQSRQNFRPQYLAMSVNSYIREGFGR